METVDTLGAAAVHIPLMYPGVLSARPSTFCYDALLKRIEADRSDIEPFVKGLKPFMYGDDISRITKYYVDETEPCFVNGWFEHDDARALYAVVRQCQPRRYVEVGSGCSTQFARRAVEDGKLNTEIISIDPAPRSIIAGLCDQTLKMNVWDVDMSVFAQLEFGDVLFWDGSHLALNGSDVVRLFLEILPILRPGVLVHIHDISLPYEYNDALKDRGYGEQYLLGAALLAGRGLKILLPVAHLFAKGELSKGGSSFWFTKNHESME